MSTKKGDLVWAKLKGFPHWPAVVQNPADAPKQVREQRTIKPILVKFCGTHDYAWMDDVLPYAENATEYTPKPGKNARLHDAIAEANRFERSGKLDESERDGSGKSAKRKPGRPKQTKESEDDDEEVKPKRRGRPPKKQTDDDSESKSSKMEKSSSNGSVEKKSKSKKTTESSESKPGRKPGRPKKDKMEFSESEKSRKDRSEASDSVFKTPKKNSKRAEVEEDDSEEAGSEDERDRKKHKRGKSRSSTDSKSKDRKEKKSSKKEKKEKSDGEVEEKKSKKRKSRSESDDVEAKAPPAKRPKTDKAEKPKAHDSARFVEIAAKIKAALENKNYTEAIQLMLPLDEDSDEADKELTAITKADLKESRLGVMVKKNQDNTESAEFGELCKKLYERWREMVRKYDSMKQLARKLKGGEAAAAAAAATATTPSADPMPMEVDNTVAKTE